MIFDYKTTKLDELQNALSSAVSQFIRGLDELVHISPIEEFLEYADNLIEDVVWNKIEEIQVAFDRIEENKKNKRKNIEVFNLKELENDE